MGNARNLARLIVDSSGDIAANNLDNAIPADGSITEAKLASSAVTETKIADTAVVASKLASNAAAANINGTAVNITLGQNGTSQAGNFFGSARGKTMNPSESWETFAVLPSATNTGARLKVMAGHNSGVNTYYEGNHDTYAYNIANGTVVNFTTSTGIGTVQVRKVKNNSYGGDGGWDYQIKKSNPQGVQAWIELFAADTSWRWYI